MSNYTYIIVEPNNGNIEDLPYPFPYELGELVPQGRPALAGVAPQLYRLEHPTKQLSAKSSGKRVPGMHQPSARFSSHRPLRNGCTTISLRRFCYRRIPTFR
jgi:hypothetical protein